MLVRQLDALNLRTEVRPELDTGTSTTEANKMAKETAQKLRDHLLWTTERSQRTK